MFKLQMSLNYAQILQNQVFEIVLTTVKVNWFHVLANVIINLIRAWLAKHYKPTGLIEEYT